MWKFPKVLIIWSRGMLGSDFMKSQGGKWELIWLGSKDLDVRDLESVNTTIRGVRPDFVLNCAAYTKVDDAEDAWRMANFEINALGVYHIAKACKNVGCGFVTISTDYVFDGTKEWGYSPEDEPNPINEYGMAKYLGEQLGLREYPRTAVIRTSWLYGGDRDSKNFVNTMLRLGSEKSEMRIISDQIWAPTYTVDLCDAISQVFSAYEAFSGRLLHFSNATDTEVSWHVFAEEIFRICRIPTRAVPVSSSEYPAKAKRPKSSRLIMTDPFQRKDWKSSLRRYLQQ